MMVPDWIDQAMLSSAVATARSSRDVARAERIRLHRDVLPSQGLRASGTHHEIYLSDARRTAPENLRTILRQPVESA